LSVYLSQTGVSQALEKKYGQEMIQQQTPLEYKELLVDYIKNNFDLNIDGQKIELLDGGIKLGNHQTDLKFILTPFAKEVETIKINIPAFQENEKHQTIFSYNLYGLVDKAILSYKNDYTATITLGEQENISTTVIVVVISSFILLLTLGLILRNRSTL